MSTVNVERAVVRRLKLREPTFRLERCGDRVYGSVTSQTFRRMDGRRRQRSIWKALQVEFGDSALRDAPRKRERLNGQWSASHAVEL